MNKRNNNIDLLKFFCILGVVMIHTSPFKQIGKGIIYIIINTLSRMAVPLFFICIGYFYYDKCSVEYTKNYIIKLIKILVIWSSIYILFDLTLILISNISNIIVVRNNIINYFQEFNITDIYYGKGIIRNHFWFLSATIFMIPIIYIIIHKNIVISCLIFTIFLNIIGVFLPMIFKGEWWMLVRDALFFGLPYSLIGISIKKYNINKISKVVSYIIIFIMFIGLFIERILYDRIWDVSGEYYILLIPLVTFIFIVVINEEVNIKTNSIFTKIGRKTLGIYLIHPLIMQIFTLVIQKCGIEKVYNCVLWQVVYTPIVLLISYWSYEYIQCLFRERLKVNK